MASIQPEDLSRLRGRRFSAKLSIREWGCSSIGRAIAWQAIGRGFESPQLHHQFPLDILPPRKPPPLTFIGQLMSRRMWLLIRFPARQRSVNQVMQKSSAEVGQSILNAIGGGN